MPAAIHENMSNGSVEIAHHFLDQFPDVKFIHHHWMNVSGILQDQVLTREHCLKLEKHQQILRGHPMLQFGFLGIFDRPVFLKDGAATEIRPDWTSLRVIKPGHASVMCDIAESADGHFDNDLSQPFQRCSRRGLVETLEQIKRKHSVELLLGFELELYLIDHDVDIRVSEPPPPWRPAPHTSLASTLRGNVADCLETCVTNLLEAGIGVQKYHSEDGQEQYEIALDPLGPVQAIDSMLQAQEIIRWTAYQHHKRALFTPKVTARRDASGLHMHVSYTKEDIASSSFRDEFLSGILNRLPLLCLFGMPSPLSYYRLKEKCWWENLVAWGTENRHAPIRQIQPQHWEMRFVDTTANPYLAFASIVAAGVMGVDQRETTSIVENRISPVKLSPEKQRELGMITTLPKSLEEAIKIGERGWQELDTYMNLKLLEIYLCVKQSEAKQFSGRTLEELAGFYADVS